MVETWYAIVTLLFVAYVVLDGFDFGAGMLSPFVARTDAERRQVLAAIGPFWDGNEVWLLAAGGALFVAFPGALASGISGFYFAIFLVLWCLIGRGLAIELRAHVDDPLWRAAWDFVLPVTSALLALFFGVAFGNLVRGVPIGPDGWFALALFTTFLPTDPVGILDVYTVFAGLFAMLALAAHGAQFLAWRTDGAVADRARTLARRLGMALALAWPVVTAASIALQGSLFHALLARPLAWAFSLVALAGMVTGFVARARGKDGLAFAASSAFLASILAATATALWPVLLFARTQGASLTAQAAASDAHGLQVALAWYAVGLPLAVGYLVVLARFHRERVGATPGGEGY
jgi:cytochrome d ubiquinol oxidase subunit II